MNRKMASIVIALALVFSLFIGVLFFHLTDQSDSILEFYVLGDSQGYQGGLAQVVEDANRNRPDFVFHTGDLTPFSTEQQYQDIYNVIKMLNVPFHTTPGNHDTRLDGRIRYEEFFGPTNYSFSIGPAHFVAFDTSEGDVHWEQLLWLESELMKTDAECKFVFTHIPPVDPRPGHDHCLLNSTTADFLINLFAETGVYTVFTGHIHVFHQSEIQGVKYVITGGAGASLAAPEEEGGVYHYIRAILTAEGFQIEKVLLGTPTITRNQVLIKGNELDITLTIQDLMNLDTIEGFSSFQNQYGNWRGQGIYVGVRVSTLVELVGGMNESQNLRVISYDGFEQLFCYGNVYPNASWYSHQGDMILAFQYNETTVPVWDDGMRIVMIPEDGAYSNDDLLATSAQGQGGNIYLSAGARWVRYVSVIEILG